MNIICHYERFICDIQHLNHIGLSDSAGEQLCSCVYTVTQIPYVTHTHYCSCVPSVTQIPTDVALILTTALRLRCPKFLEMFTHTHKVAYTSILLRIPQRITLRAQLCYLTTDTTGTCHSSVVGKCCLCARGTNPGEHPEYQKCFEIAITFLIEML